MRSRSAQLLALAFVTALILAIGLGWAWSPRAVLAQQTDDLVIVASPYADGSPELVAFKSEVAKFSAATSFGVVVLATGEPLPEEVDILIAWPGEIRELYEEGLAFALSLNPVDLAARFGEGHAALASNDDGDWYMIPISADNRSLIWANALTFMPESEGGLGYAVPATYNELIAMSMQTHGAGLGGWYSAAWSGSETGWPLTDTFEDLLIHLAGGGFYYEVFQHRVPFTHPTIREAWQLMEPILRDYSNDGQEIASTGWWNIGCLARPPANAAWEPPTAPAPEPCTFHRQASFLRDVARFDYDPPIHSQLVHFPTPQVNPGIPEAVIYAGEAAALLQDRPGAHALMAFLAGEPGFTDEFGSELAAVGTIPANTNYGGSFPDSDTAQWAASFYAASLAGNAGLDGSSLLPTDVKDALHQGLIDYVTEEDPDLSSILLGIEQSWSDYVSPSELVGDLVDDVLALNVHHGIVNSLNAKLQNVASALTDLSRNKYPSAIGKLEGFINHVEAQAGKKIPDDAAEALISQAQHIISLLTG